MLHRAEQRNKKRIFIPVKSSGMWMRHEEGAWDDRVPSDNLTAEAELLKEVMGRPIELFAKCSATLTCHKSGSKGLYSFQLVCVD